MATDLYQMLDISGFYDLICWALSLILLICFNFTYNNAICILGVLNHDFFKKL